MKTKSMLCGRFPLFFKQLAQKLAICHNNVISRSTTVRSIFSHHELSNKSHNLTTITNFVF